MAIFRGGAILVPDGSSNDNTTFDSVVENAKIFNYWGDETALIFKILNVHLERLFAKARKERKEVALKVNNISDPFKVSAQWVIFDEFKAKKTEDYYVMDEKFYDDGGVRLKVTFDGKEGTVNSLKSFRYNYICAIIGSAEIDGTTHYSVFFHPGYYVFKYVHQTSTGPDGGGGGIELP